MQNVADHRAAITRVLSNDDVRRYAPAAYSSTSSPRTGPKYVFIDTAQLVNTLREHDFHPTEASQSVTRLGNAQYAKHMIRFRHESESVSVLGCVPEVILINAHDSSSSFQLRSGLYRFACCNGLIVSLAEFGVIRVPHRGNVIANVVEAAELIASHFQDLGHTIDRMARTQLSQQERLTFAEKSLQLRFRTRKHLPFGAAELLTTRREEDEGHDLWTTYNTIQENVMVGGIQGRSAKGRRTQSRRIAAIPESIRLNLELWHQAMELIRA
jgi:hypothetical protein